MASYKHCLVILIPLHNLGNWKKVKRELLILLNFVCDEVVDESSQRSVLSVCEHSYSSQKIIIVLRGKAGGILKRSELIILAAGLGKCSLTTDIYFFFNWLFWLFSIQTQKIKKFPKECGDKQCSHKYTCPVPSAVLFSHFQPPWGFLLHFCDFFYPWSLERISSTQNGIFVS